MIGDDDEVRLEHATAMYRSLPNAEFAVVPGTSHGLLVEKPALCNMIITDFLTKDRSRRSRQSAAPSVIAPDSGRASS
jgi:pimeloyl-ACP methyl ester carboxylesterase